ncbi:MAG: very-short-patch-repair endonuclease [Alteromonadaceae bacterium]
MKEVIFKLIKDYKMELKHRIRTLSRYTTLVEQNLWRELQKRNLNGYNFTRQASVGSYFVDFLSAQLKLVIQLDNNLPDTAENEIRQTNQNFKNQLLESRGYLIIRFWHHELSGDLSGVVDSLVPMLARRGLELNLPSPYETGQTVLPSPSGQTPQTHSLKD